MHVCWDYMKSMNNAYALLIRMFRKVFSCLFTEVRVIITCLQCFFFQFHVCKVFCNTSIVALSGVEFSSSFLYICLQLTAFM